MGADVWVKQALGALGVTGGLALGAAALVLGAAVVAWERKRGVRPPLRARWFGWLLVESLVYAVVLAALVGGAVGALVGFRAEAAMVMLQPAFGLPTKLALSLGAGLYEELVFRVVLVGGLAWGLGRVWGGKTEPVGMAGLGGGETPRRGVSTGDMAAGERRRTRWRRWWGRWCSRGCTTSARLAMRLRWGRFCFAHCLDWL